MKLKDILTEGLSQVLYHATTFRSTLDILENNTLGKKENDISFARSLTGDFHLGNKRIGVIFEVDGRKLSQRFKGKPVGTEDWDDDDNINYRGRDNKQLEERIVGPIPNFTSYVNNAVIFIPEEYLEDDTHDKFDVSYDENLMVLDKVMDQLDGHNISYRVVTSEKGLFDKRTDDRAKLNAMIASRHGPDDKKVPDNYAKKFGIDQRQTFVITIVKDFATAEYMADHDVDEEDVDYLDQEYWEGVSRVKIKSADNNLDRIEDRVRKKIVDKLGNKATGNLMVFADYEDD